MSSHSLVTGREALRFFVRYFARSKGNADTTLQWMDVIKVKCTPGKLDELVARWDMWVTKPTGPRRRASC